MLCANGVSPDADRAMEYCLYRPGIPDADSNFVDKERN